MILLFNYCFFDLLWHKFRNPVCNISRVDATKGWNEYDNKFPDVPRLVVLQSVADTFDTGGDENNSHNGLPIALLSG